MFPPAIYKKKYQKNVIFRMLEMMTHCNDLLFSITKSRGLYTSWIHRGPIGDYSLLHKSESSDSRFAAHTALRMMVLNSFYIANESLLKKIPQIEKIPPIIEFFDTEPKFFAHQTFWAEVIAELVDKDRVVRVSDPADTNPLDYEPTIYEFPDETLKHVCETIVQHACNLQFAIDSDPEGNEFTLTVARRVGDKYVHVFTAPNRTSRNDAIDVLVKLFEMIGEYVDTMIRASAPATYIDGHEVSIFPSAHALELYVANETPDGWITRHQCDDIIAALRNSDVYATYHLPF